MSRSKQIFVGAGLFIAVLLGRNYFESRSEFKLGSTEETRGNIQGAITHFDRSIHWYFPFNPFMERSIERLWNIGQAAETKNEKLALLAYDSARGAIYSLRSLVQPFEPWLTRINGRIAELRAREEATAGGRQSLEQAKEFHRRLLTQDERPVPFWSLVVVFGFLAWVGSVFGLIWRGFDREGRMHLGRSIPWIAGFVLSFAVWIIGLVRA